MSFDTDQAPHPYEDEFDRATAWEFDAVFVEYARTTNSMAEFDAALINHSYALVNAGNRERAVLWAKFGDRKWGDIFAGTDPLARH